MTHTVQIAKNLSNEKIYKTYKYRILPTEDQAELFKKTFGCCRFVFNKILALKIEHYEKTGKYLQEKDCLQYYSKILKKEFPWLKEVDSRGPQLAISFLEIAYTNFFLKKKNYPRFKSKKYSKQSYTTLQNHADRETQGIMIDFNKNAIKLPKAGWVKAILSKTFAGDIKRATIILSPSGKWFCYLMVEINNHKKIISTNSIGIDLGLKSYLTFSTGEKIENPHFLKKYQSKITKLQKKLNRQQRGSQNYKKTKIKIAKAYERVKNQRLDFLHKLSFRIISENQTICTESLDILQMLEKSNRELNCQIFDASWYEFTRQLEYKSKWYHRQYIKINTYFPSSQICSCCGAQIKSLKNLKIRKWTCPYCLTTHDRDINAAKNILKEGIQNGGRGTPECKLVEAKITKPMKQETEVYQVNTPSGEIK